MTSKQLTVADVKQLCYDLTITAKVKDFLLTTNMFEADVLLSRLERCEKVSSMNTLLYAFKKSLQNGRYREMFSPLEIDTLLSLIATVQEKMQAYSESLDLELAS